MNTSCALFLTIKFSDPDNRVSIAASVVEIALFITTSFTESPEVELPPVEIQAFLERKQVLAAGGKKAPNRAWKNIYTVLCGQLLCFFKNKEDFRESKALCAPIGIHNSNCTVAEDYIKRKHTFRLVNVDGSEFLFSCISNEEMSDWVQKISFRAKLPPSQQLLHLVIPKV